MSHVISPALADYAPAFAQADQPFLTYYAIGANGESQRTQLSRGEFWTLSARLAAGLRQRHLGAGDAVLLAVGANQLLDLALRLAAAMTGVVPVTVNWQADDEVRVAYKLTLTQARLVLYDGLFSAAGLAHLRVTAPTVPQVALAELAATEALATPAPDVAIDATRIVIFTSGTTGEPKGVALPYRSYRTNRDTFEQFLAVSAADRLAVLLVNPLHHTNSTAISDWAMRRPGTRLHLVERYATVYWRLLAELVEAGGDRFVAPLVSRHFDFLESLDREERLPVTRERLLPAMARTDFLIGSAPVGPTTVQRLQRYAGRTPIVRFGSTETCLQVLGIPATLTEEVRLAAFQRGWEHRHAGHHLVGYYIGRPHPPHTDVRIVRGILPGQDGFMCDCELGEPGYLVTRGANLMSGYIGNPEATRKAFSGDWYLGLQDICFALHNPTDGGRDYYWLGRDSSLLIRGGANYAYDQINSELADFVARHYELPRQHFEVAVVGLRVDSEHEDSCCVTLELHDDVPAAVRSRIDATFLHDALGQVSKGARPDFLRVAAIPRNFKGAVLVPELRDAFRAYLGRGA